VLCHSASQIAAKDLAAVLPKFFSAASADFFRHVR
jgi:hypothetical protein